MHLKAESPTRWRSPCRSFDLFNPSISDHTCLAVCCQNFEPPVCSGAYRREDHRDPPSEHVRRLRIKWGFLPLLEVRKGAVICHNCEASGAPSSFPSREEVSPWLNGSAKQSIGGSWFVSVASLTPRGSCAIGWRRYFSAKRFSRVRGVLNIQVIWPTIKRCFLTHRGLLFIED